MKTKYLLPFFLIFFAIFTLGLLFKYYQDFKNEEKHKKEVYLNQVLDQSVKILERELDKMAIFVSSFKSHVLQTETELNPDQAYNFIKEQLDFLDYSENVIVNYINKDHFFVYSVGSQTKDVNNLAGTSVTKIRDQNVINKLNEFLDSEDILAFLPLNLYEGHAGLPINFRLKIKEDLKGYFAIIVDVKNLLTPITESEIMDEFTFRFTAGDEQIEFDREKVYDGTQVYNQNVDQGNLHREVEAYTYQITNMIGMPFSIGIAYKDIGSVGSIMNFVNSIVGLLLLLLLTSLFLCYLYYQNIQKSREERIVNSKLSKSNRLLRKFIFASSHDLKQPLVNIANFHQLLARKNDFDDGSQQYIQIIGDNVNHMSNLLDDLLIYSKVINDEKVKEVIEIVDVIDLISSSHDKEKVKIIHDDLLPCFGVKSEIIRLFQNLIGNAIKYNESQIKKIEITSMDVGNAIQYTVSDNGIGIKKEYHDIVFSEFQRVHKQSYSGTGLGLSICKEIVMNHGGFITITDKAKGGTSVIFTILKHD